MKLSPPADINRLASDLGISDAQLAKLRTDDRYKDENALVKAMQKWWRETRDEPRLLGKTGGIVHSSAGALRVVQRHAPGGEGAEDSGEAVSKSCQAEFDAIGRAKQRHSKVELASSMRSVEMALTDRLKALPEGSMVDGEIRRARKQIRLALEKLDRELRSLERAA